MAERLFRDMQGRSQNSLRKARVVPLLGPTAGVCRRHCWEFTSRDAKSKTVRAGGHPLGIRLSGTNGENKTGRSVW